MDKGSDSMVMVNDLRAGIPDWMLAADMVYCDPPWNQGNVNAFITKAGLDSYITSFSRFCDTLFAEIARIAPMVCYLEIGDAHVADFATRLMTMYPVAQAWEVTYYNKHRCHLLRGAVSDYCEHDYDRTGRGQNPQHRRWFGAAQRRGRPLHGSGGSRPVACHEHGVRFLGTELNPRRLAVAIDRVNKLGGNYEGSIS